MNCKENEMDNETVSPKTVKSDCVAGDSNEENTTKPTESVSKRQLKRLAKREKWEANKPIRKAMEKERKKLLNEAKRKLALEAEQCTKKRLLEEGDVNDDEDEETKSVAKRPKLMKKMSESSCRTRIVVDVAYDHLMDESEISKTCKQIQRCYAANRRIQNPLQFYVTNFTNASMEKLIKLGCLKWDVHREPRTHLECFDKTEIVYLTSDSPNVLMELDESKVYVIGGLVDHNKHKGLCLSLAEKNGVGHARLPIDEFVTMKTTKVLTVFHVFEILLNVTKGMSWKCALIETVPKRKLPTIVAAERMTGKDEESKEIDAVDDAQMIVQ